MPRDKIWILVFFTKLNIIQPDNFYSFYAQFGKCQQITYVPKKLSSSLDKYFSF